MRRYFLLTCMTAMLAGCVSASEYERPVVETPSSWYGAPPMNAASEGGQLPSNAARDWWASFNSPYLNDLMDMALAQNTDLRGGVQRIEQARAALKVAGADLWPSASGSAGATRSKSNPVAGKNNYATSLSSGVSVSYELDLFGANRAGVNAAEAGYQGSVYDYEALRLTVIGDVAASYFTLMNLRERLFVAERNLDNAKEVLRIVQARVDAGAESDLELSRQKGAVASGEASLAALREQITNAENALAVLVGQPPQSIEIIGRGLKDVNVPDIAAGQPSILLERRPDLLAAEADLKAADANIDAARAAFYPSITLGLSDSLSLAGFGEPSSAVLSLSSSLVAPIFTAGRLEGGVEQATARQIELAENYRGEVLTAFQEVEDALAAVKAAKAREEFLQEATTQAQRAYDLSKSRYDAGAIDYQTLLDTQTTVLNAEDNYTQAKLARLSAAINLYRSLGGAWTVSD